MKIFHKTLLIALTLSLCSAGFAQNNAIDKYFSEYADDERFTKVSISSKMFSLFANFNAEDKDEQEVIETISKLKGLKILVGNEINESSALYKSINSVASVNYEELMTVENSEQQMVFYIAESNGQISELVMLMYENQNVLMLSLVGDINLNELSKLSDKMDIQGFEEFKNLENK